MNGEPFCYGSRLTVRQVLQMRAAGATVTDLLKDHPELKLLGIAHVYAFAGEHKADFAEFFAPDGSLAGPGLNADEVDRLPASLRVAAVVS
jgi:uncharacterized protein (DUF433 family)